MERPASQSTLIESERGIPDQTASMGCSHCGMPIPESWQDTGFCCGGCRSAYTLIRSEGLEQYYDLLHRMSDGGSRPVDERLSQETFIHLDTPSFWQDHVVPLQGGRVRVGLRLHGIHCAACVWLLERLPQFCPGVVEARVDLQRSSIEITWDPTRCRLSEIAQQMAKIGYRSAPLSRSSMELAKRQQRRQQLIQIAIAGACSGNVMLLAIAIYCGEWSGMAAEHLQLLRIASAAVGLVSLLGPGSLFFRGAWAALRVRTPHMDLPIALGLGVGAISGAWNTLRGEGELYFDSLSMLVFLLLVGRALQSRQQQAACEAVDLLAQLTPGTTRRVRNGLVEAVAVEEIEVGDILEIAPEQTIPVDGVIVSGESEIDASLLTGESLPQGVEVGDRVTAGTLNRTRLLRMKAERVGRETRLGQLVESIHRASLNKAPVVQWADRISGVFVIVVILLAMGVGGAWFWIDRNVWTDRVISLLIVACPCALGLATPLAIAVGLGRSARRGILIKGGDSLQRLAQPGLLVLDKTGTLTEGKLTIHQWFGSSDSLRAAAAVEKYSQHPVAVSIRDEWRRRTMENDLPAASGLESHLGLGVLGSVEGREVIVGSRAFLDQHGAKWTPEQLGLYQQILDRGQMPMIVAIDRVIVAIASLADTIRPEAQEVITRLQKQGWKVKMLSGDHPNIVKRVGIELGFQPEDILGGATPEEKLAWIQRWKTLGLPVMMVGDGVNDAAALAAADIGIAVRGGAEVSLQAADIFLANGSLNGIESIIETAKRTMWVIRRNSFASLMYNLLAVSTAAMGWLHPLAAALLMPISSLTVVTVTLFGHLRTRSTMGPSES